MDVTSSPLGGRTPLTNAARLSGASCAPGSASQQLIATGGGAGITPQVTPPPVDSSAEYVGEQPDGPLLVTSAGVRIRRKRIGGRQVSDAAVQQAVIGISQLPLAHQLLLRQLGVVIDLVPEPRLAPIAGLDARPVLGATNVDQVRGRWVPEGIRIAVDSPTSSPNSPDAIAEIVQHEVGHVVSVVARQDRSEAAAVAYARAY